MNQFQTFGEVFSALRRRAYVILAITFVGCMVSLFVALSQPKLYEATSVVQIENARVPDQLAGASAQADDAVRRVRLIEQRLMSRDNLVRIMEEHDLFLDDPTQAMSERVFLMRQAARLTPIVNQSQPYAPGANIPSGLMITVQLADPVTAATLANELMNSVIIQSRERSTGRARDTLDVFAAEEVRVGAEIELLESRIAEFKSQNAEALPAGVADLRSQLLTLREAQLERATKILELETANNRQREETKDRQIGLLREQQQLIATRIEQIQAQIAAAPEVERTLNNMERQMTQLQDQYSVITRRKAEAELGQMLEDRQQTDRFEVLETALVPEHPISRSRKRTAILGGVASLVFGVIAAFGLELMNPAIRTPGQMERSLGVRPVVAIPVVSRPRGSTGKGLRIGAIFAALALAAWAALRAFPDKVPAVSNLFDRFFRGAARSS